ncbi:hypothetical protein A0H81_05397 [Grifola frondosa]|uniref:Uncharacterized protein n=1 Tax=Grifola frondosa TaxID=5627 RepID=A0A1C7MC97_GRIFR|nr:hypothetical protein A0H81_05397 [Grifola frondosa]
MTKSGRSLFWKTRNCEEMKTASVPLAVQEYIQNQVGQILKEKCVLQWYDWVREDLRGSAEARDARKRWLIERFPGLLSGPQGTHFRAAPWQPIYILHATLPHSALAQTPHTTDLDVCTVMWRHASAGLTGLSVYNNHLDVDANIYHFAVDGASTNSASPWAAGEKGNGFLRASMFLLQETDKVERSDAAREDLCAGLSFRVGHHVGTVKSGHAAAGIPEQLLITLRDLTPVSLTELAGDQEQKKQKKKQKEPLGSQIEQGELLEESPLTQDGSPSIDLRRYAGQSQRVRTVYSQRISQSMAIKGDPELPTEPYHEISLVQDDEVAISVLGLPGTLTPEYVFSGVYGIFPYPRSWTIPSRGPGTPSITFYKPEKPHPGDASINYIGDLSLSHDRSAVILSGPRFHEYKCHLSAAVDVGIRTMPDLAVELALDILTERGAHDGSIGRVLAPPSTEGKDAYHTAFTEALRHLTPALPEDHPLYPFAADSDDEALITQLGMVGCAVAPHVKALLEKSGAFPPVREYARAMLLAAPPTRTPVRAQNAYDAPWASWSEAACRRGAMQSRTRAPCGTTRRGRSSWASRRRVWSIRTGASAGWDRFSTMRSQAIGRGVAARPRKSLMRPCFVRTCVAWKGRSICGSHSKAKRMGSLIENEDAAERRRRQRRTGVRAQPSWSRRSAPAHGERSLLTPDPRPSVSPAHAADRSAAPPLPANLTPSSSSPKEAPASGGTDADADGDGLDNIWCDMRARFSACLQQTRHKERRSAAAKVSSLAAALSAKEQALGAEVARSADLEKALQEVTLRAQTLDGSVRKLERRERTRSVKLQAELDGLKRRLSAVFVPEGGSVDGEDDDEDEEELDEILEDEEAGEPPRKKLRAE